MCDECDERYLFVINDKLSTSQAETLFRDLISRKKNVEISSGQEPSRVDLHSRLIPLFPVNSGMLFTNPFTLNLPI